MKKKITAVLLVLCMVLGMLPLSAMAAKTTVELDGHEYTVTKNADGTATLTDADGNVFDGDKNGYYQFKIVSDGDSDKLQYYTTEGPSDTKTISLTEWITLSFDVNAPAGTNASDVKVARGSIADKDIQVGTTEELPTLTLEGYTFDGWNVADISTLTKDTTLKAQWTKKAAPTYTITLDLNYEDAPKATAFTTDPETGYLTTVTDAFFSPTREGYGFKGWAKDQKATAATIAPEALKTTAFTEADDGTTLYAVWEKAKAVKVTFDANGGKVSKTSDTTGEDGKLTSLPTPTYSGRVFLGWFTARTGGTEVTEKYVFTEVTTIYAQWGFKITFDANGGKLTGETTAANTGADGKLATMPEDPTHQGKFLGWNTEKDGSGDAVTINTVFEKATTVYATWSFTVTFDEDYEGGKKTEIPTLGNGKLALTEKVTMPKPVREGYKFLGWFDAKENGTEITSETKFEKNTTVYAHWAEVVEIVVEAKEDKTTGGISGTVSLKSGDDEDAPELDVSKKEVRDAWVKENAGKSIEIKVDTTESSVKSIAAKIPKDYVTLFKEAATDVYVDTPYGDFTLTPADMSKLADLGTDISLGNEKESKQGLPDPPKTNKTKTTYTGKVEVFLKDAEGHDITAAKNLKIKFTVDTSLVLKANEKEKVWYLDNGKLTEKQDGSLNAGKITFLLKHFSEYVIGAEEETTNVGGGNGTGGGGGGGSASSGYSVSVSKTTNGKVSVSPSKAEEGDTVTITVTPDKGYELDKLTVKDADGNTIKTTKTSDGKYTFTMPDGKVTIEATFKAIEEEDTAPAPATPSFSDVPSSFWAYQQIRWVAEQGIMGGYANGTFGADNNTTRQALWMVLGRLSGELDTNSTMAEAREWAIANNVSDGTNPGNAMSRQQMVTMLYRYAQMKGYATNGSTDLSTYPDAAGVASYAQDALSWAVANGVVTGTTDGRLNPEGTASRAHFAVFMYRFCGLYADEA